MRALFPSRLRPASLAPSFRCARSCGPGRKSRTTWGFPIGSFVYLIFAPMDRVSLAPLVGSDDASNARAICGSYGPYPADDMPKIGQEFRSSVGDAAVTVATLTPVARFSACAVAGSNTPLWWK